MPIALFAEDKAEQILGSGISIATDPEGATVLLDGIERGKTPLSIAQIPVGSHRLIVRKDGWQERSTSFTAENGKRVELYLELKRITGFVTISAQPGTVPEGRSGGAFRPQVLIDDTRSNPGTSELTEGYHTIAIKAFGYIEERRSIYIAEGSTQNLDLVLRVAPFAVDSATLSRARFNPGNSGLLGTTTLHFTVTAPGTGSVMIRNAQGDVVFSKALDSFTDWAQEASWNGRGTDAAPLVDGEYRIAIEAKSDSGTETSRRELSVTLDSSIEIRPSSFDTMSSGLMFVPGAFTAPRGSWQVGLEVLSGKPAGSSGTFDRPPVSLSASIAPLDGWEVALCAGERSDIEDNGGQTTAMFSGGASVKRSTAESESGERFKAALSLRYALSDRSWVSPVGTDDGFEVAIPLEWRPKTTQLALLAAPGILFGDGEEAILGLGLALRFPTLTAGLSARSVFPFEAPLSDARYFCGAELRWFPPPSTIVFALSGGAWYEGDEAGSFMGLGIAFLY